MKQLLKFFAQNPGLKEQEKAVFKNLFDTHQKSMSNQNMLLKLKEGGSKYNQDLLSELYEPELLRDATSRAAAADAAGRVDIKKARELIELLIKG